MPDGSPNGSGPHVFVHRDPTGSTRVGQVGRQATRFGTWANPDHDIGRCDRRIGGRVLRKPDGVLTGAELSKKSGTDPSCVEVMTPAGDTLGHGGRVHAQMVTPSGSSRRKAKTTPERRRECETPWRCRMEGCRLWIAESRRAAAIGGETDARSCHPRRVRA